MKTNKYVIMALALISLSQIISCGDNNMFRPYEAPWGSTIRVDLKSLAIISRGDPFPVSFAVWAVDEEGMPINNIDIGMCTAKVEANYSWTSFYFGPLTDAMFVLKERVSYWDDSGCPHYITDHNGQAFIEMWVPQGWAGAIDPYFWTKSDTETIDFEVTGGGTMCFDGTDNDSDALIDVEDAGCTDYTDLLE